VTGLKKGGMLRRVEGKLFVMLMAAACAALGACSHSGGSSGAPLVKRHSAGSTDGPGTAIAAKNGVPNGPTDLVAAVSNGGDSPVGLKFQLGQRPVSGQPLVITLQLVANQALEHLEARFLPDDDLTLTQGGDFDAQGHLDAGEAVDHAVTVIPAHDGVHTVLATLTTGVAAEAVSRSFVIPIVVGSTVAAAPVVDSPAPAKASAPKRRKWLPGSL
jgi:hypothetical protein